METETDTTAAHLQQHPSGAFIVSHGTPGNGEAISLTPDQLAAIVQQAYDRHGIIAMPPYAQEADFRGGVSL